MIRQAGRKSDKILLLASLAIRCLGSIAGFSFFLLIANQMVNLRFENGWWIAEMTKQTDNSRVKVRIRDREVDSRPHQWSFNERSWKQPFKLAGYKSSSIDIDAWAFRPNGEYDTTGKKYAKRLLALAMEIIALHGKFKRGE